MRLATLLIALACACSAPRPDVELVASVPVETAFGFELGDAQAVWLAMIGRAQTSIEVAQFYVSNEPGSRLEPIVAALEAASRRGVRVLLLADKGFATTYPETLDRLGRSGVIVRLLEFPDGGTLHAKYFIVDQREAFLGSQNFDWRALEHNLELGVRIGDADVVQSLATIFTADWQRAGGQPVAVPPAPPSALVASPRELLPDGVAWDLPRLIAMLDAARARIRIQLLTYHAGDWTELEAALLRAAKRGVRVELLLADWVKREATIGGLQQLARTPRIAIKLATVPRARSGFIPFARVIHAKLLVVDGRRAWIGTSNWERDYFYKDRNVGLIVDDITLARQLDAFFERTWFSPYATLVDPEATYTPPQIDETP